LFQFELVQSHCAAQHSKACGLPSFIKDVPENTLANDHRPAERGFDGVAWQERADVYSSAKTIFFYGYFLFCFVSFLRD
ncbi:hypothetical protein DKP78_25610, partial [Enterococcus faecium]